MESTTNSNNNNIKYIPLRKRIFDYLQRKEVDDDFAPQTTQNKRQKTENNDNIISSQESTLRIEDHTLLSTIQSTLERSQGQIQDVVLCIGRDNRFERLYGNSILLALHSQVFRAMFFASPTLKRVRTYFTNQTYLLPFDSDDEDIEMGRCESEETEIQQTEFFFDESFELFQMAVDFMSGKSIDVPHELQTDLIILAARYQISALVDSCIHLLESQLQPSNVCSILSFACSFRLSDLEKTCLEFIDDHADQVLSADGLPSFCRLEEEVAYKVLSRELVVEDELVVFEAAVTWGQSKLTQKLFENSKNFTSSTDDTQLTLSNLIVRLLRAVRFPQIDPKDLRTKVIPTGLVPMEMYSYLLTSSEVSNIDIPLVSMAFTENNGSLDNMRSSEVTPHMNRKRPQINTFDRISVWLDCDFFEGQVAFKLEDLSKKIPRKLSSSYMTSNS